MPMIVAPVRCIIKIGIRFFRGREGISAAFFIDKDTHSEYTSPNDRASESEP